MEKPKILFLGSGPYALNRRDKKDKFSYFRKYFSCMFLTPVNSKSAEITGLRETEVIDDFTLIPFPYHYKNSFMRNLLFLFNTVSKALYQYHIKHWRYKVIISNNPLMTGLCAIIISKLTSAQSIIEVNGDFNVAFKYDDFNTVRKDRLNKIKTGFIKVFMKFVLKHAGSIKLLYPGQLDFLFRKNKLDRFSIKSFSDFVPVSYFLNHEKHDKKYILLVGYPWYLKGVDILIKAFNIVSKDFPGHGLKIIGWCPKGRKYFEELAKENKMIELLEPVSYMDIIPFFLNCSLYVLASRTEAMGRVLLEALASGKPVIASNVGGVPAVIQDGVNGILFKKEDIEELAQSIKKILTDGNYAEKLINNGLISVREKFSEEIYIKNYKHLIDGFIAE